MSDVNIYPDNEPILHKGTSTPYLAIFDGNGKPIMDEVNNLPIGMLCTSWEYNFNEEDVDDGEFELQTNNPDLAGIDALKYKMPLRLQWGHIYPDGSSVSSQLMLVMIIAKKVEFTPEGTIINIKFSDPSVLSKLEPAAYNPEAKNLLEGFNGMLKGEPKYGIIVLDNQINYVKKPAILQRAGTNSDVMLQYELDRVNENLQKYK